MWNRELTRAPMTFIAVVAVSGTLTVLFNCSDKPAGPDTGTFDVGTSDAGGPTPGTWATIPAGTYLMGAQPSEPCQGFNEDQHQVTLTHGFEIQSTEVTQGEFQALMGYNPSYFFTCGTTCPVETVNWHEAVAYCNELSAKKGLAQCYTCSGSGASVTCSEASAYSGQNVYSCPGYRLPTEAEWEYAYRAETMTAYYSGANESTICGICESEDDANLDKIAWYCGNSSSTTHPVGQRLANAWFLYDMGGNVLEWCHDRYTSALGFSTTIDPVGSSPGSDRVFRGGAWYSLPSVTRAASREGLDPMSRDFGLGFRCSRTK